MKVSELVDKLSELEDKDKEIVVETLSNNDYDFWEYNIDFISESLDESYYVINTKNIYY